MPTRSTPVGHSPTRRSPRCGTAERGFAGGVEDKKAWRKSKNKLVPAGGRRGWYRDTNRVRQGQFPPSTLIETWKKGKEGEEKKNREKIA
jgi:hypothetical protein